MSYFDRTFNLALSEADQQDLVAYLRAAGNGAAPNEAEGYLASMKELNDFSNALGTAIASHDKELIALAVDTIGGELRDLTEQYPDHKDTTVSAESFEQRMIARQALKEQVITLRRIGMAATEDRFEDAASDYNLYRERMKVAVPTALYNAEDWSLFNRGVHDAHYAALSRALASRQKRQ